MMATNQNGSPKGYGDCMRSIDLGIPSWTQSGAHSTISPGTHALAKRPHHYNSILICSGQKTFDDLIAQASYPDSSNKMSYWIYLDLTVSEAFIV